MPLQELMYRQVAELAQFFEPSAKKLWILHHPGDLKDMVVKILSGLKDDPENNNVFFAFDTAFNDADQYFSDIRGDFEEELHALEPEFRQFGIELPPPRMEPGTALKCLARRVDAVADLFPEGTGSLVFLLRPESIGNDAKLAEALAQLAQLAKAPRSKYTLVYFGKAKEITELPAKAEDACGGQNMQLSPEQIEAQLEIDLKLPTINWFERMQYTAMAGAIAFAKGDLDKAMQLQVEALAAAENKGNAVDVATGLYNLGNTLLKKKEFAEAEQRLTQAAEICLEEENDNLLAMVMINLGVAMQRQGKLEEALTNFDAGRALFKAVKYPAGEIHALDSKAASLAAASKNEEAEQAWREALKVAAAIPDGLADLRESCIEDVNDKLRRFFEITGQKDKARALPPAAEE